MDDTQDKLPEAKAADVEADSEAMGSPAAATVAESTAMLEAAAGSDGHTVAVEHVVPEAGGATNGHAAGDGHAVPDVAHRATEMAVSQAAIASDTVAPVETVGEPSPEVEPSP